MAYAKVATSYRHGGLNLGTGTPDLDAYVVVLTYAEEDSFTYELGWKSTFRGGLTFNVAGFFTVYDDLLNTTNNGCPDLCTLLDPDDSTPLGFNPDGTRVEFDADGNMGDELPGQFFHRQHRRGGSLGARSGVCLAQELRQRQFPVPPRRLGASARRGDEDRRRSCAGIPVRLGPSPAVHASGRIQGHCRLSAPAARTRRCGEHHERSDASGGRQLHDREGRRAQPTPSRSLTLVPGFRASRGRPARTRDRSMGAHAEGQQYPRCRLRDLDVPHDPDGPRPDLSAYRPAILFTGVILASALNV